MMNATVSRAPSIKPGKNPVRIAATGKLLQWAFATAPAPSAVCEALLAELVDVLLGLLVVEVEDTIDCVGFVVEDTGFAVLEGKVLAVLITH